MNVVRRLLWSQGSFRRFCSNASTRSSAAHGANKEIQGISAQEFTERRTRLFELLLKRAHSAEPQAHGDSIVKAAPNVLGVFPGGTSVNASHEVPHIFRQDTNMQYLSGLTEPDAILLIHNTSDGASQSRSVLFVTRKGARESLWHGASPSDSEVRAASGVDAVLGVEEYASYVSALLRQPVATTSVFMREDAVVNLAKSTNELVGALRRPDYTNSGRVRSVADPTVDVHTLRARKSPAELRLIREACRIGALSIRSAMQHTRPGVNENALWGVLEGEVRWRGSSGLAYPPVIACGNRANTLHYISNNLPVRDGELVLIDAGCLVHGYMSDMTRTYPVSSSSMSQAQRKLYEAVRDTQARLIASFCKPGVSLQQLYTAMHVLLAAHLHRLRLVKSSVLAGALHDAKQAFGSTNPAAEQLDAHSGAITTDGASNTEWNVFTFCPHDVGHHLGLDVHDCPSLNRHAPLEPGAIITIEPGLYVSDSGEFRSCAATAPFAGVGVRIEDDILITESGCELLSPLVPTQLHEIERLVGTARRFGLDDAC